MMSFSQTTLSGALHRIAVTLSMAALSMGPALASGGWPDCDTTCLVHSYTLESDTVQCLDELAAYTCASLTLVDTCTMEQTLAFHVIGGGADTVTTCNATTAYGIGPDGAVRLLGMTASTGLTTTDMFVETAAGLTLTQYANDIAILTGEVANQDDPDQIFEVFIVYENRVDGSDWTGGYKYAMGCDPPTDTWDIYTIKADQSHLLGKGAFDGSLLHLQHAPSSQFFGFQVGEGANDHNCDYGAGGWFSWEGTLCGTEVSGALGDVIVDLDCESDFDPCTAQSIAYFNAYVEDCGVLQYSIDIVRHDDEAPVITGLPNDTIVECTPDGIEPDGVTATDNCPVPGFPTLEYEGIFEVEAMDDYCRTFEERWRAEDECGNVATAVRLIHQFEDEPPVMVGDEIVIIECDEWPGGFEPPFQDLVDAGLIDVTDNCEVDTVLIEYGVMSGGCHYDHIMTYTPIDVCGNVGESLYQIVVVDDTTPPTLVDVPADTSISCTTPPEAVDELPYAIDNCDPAVNLTFEINYLDDGDGCDETYIIERIFIAEDCSYNHALDTQLVHVVDTAAPVLALTIPNDTLVHGCFEDIDTSTGAMGSATFTSSDDCGEIVESLTHEDAPVQYPCGEGGGSGTIERTWTLTATDCAGNVSTVEATQTIEVVDDEAPDISVESPVVLYCGDWYDGYDAAEAIALGWLTVSDNCALDSVATTLVGEFSFGCAGSRQVIFTAVDACGNDTALSQIINLIDTVAPVFTVIPADETLPCDGDPAPYAEGEAVAVDACSEVTITTHDELVIGDCASSAVWERTITATDVCGNEAEHVQRFTRVDDVPPTIDSHPADTTVFCTLIPFEEGSVTYSDDCDAAPEFEVTDDTVSYTCPGTFTVERHFTATDCSGNVGEEIQIIQVLDTVAPVVVTSGVQIEYSCSEWTCDIELLEELGHVSATDNCGEVDLSVTCLDFSGGCLDPNGVVTLLYTAVDPCGNTTQVEQILHLIDTIAPDGSITCPDDVTLDLASDCTFDLGDPDPAAPWGAPTGSATDLCDDDPELEFSFADAEPVYDCGDAGGMTIERTHTLVAMDRCGNADTVTCIQTIVLQDVTGPVITLDGPLPQNIMGCLADTDTTLAGLGSLTATAEDACGGAVTIGITYSDEVTTTCTGDDALPEGNATLDRTFTVTATDCGGNSTVETYTQTVNFFDIMAPTLTLTCPPDTAIDALADCTAESDPAFLGAPAVDAQDNCDTDVDYSVTYTDVETPGACAGSRTIERTFTVTATDDCGQSTTEQCSHTIEISDVTPPTIVMTCPDDAEIALDEHCDWSGSSGTPLTIVTDGCDPSPSLTLTHVDHDTTLLCAGDDDIIEGSFSFVRTFTATATDDCGNVATESCDQLVTLLDTAAPDVHELETLSTDTLFLDAMCETDLTPAVNPAQSAEDGCDSDVALGLTYTDDPAVYEALSDGVALQIDTVSMGGVTGASTYRLYAVLNNPGDCLSAVVGEGTAASWITSTAEFYQHPLGAVTPSTIDPVLYGMFPELEYDSWVTIGIDHVPDPTANESATQVVESTPWVADFEAGESIALNSSFGDGWFALPTSSNGTPDAEGRVLLAQLTTSGHVSGQIYLQVLQGGPGGSDMRYTLSFGNACTAEDGNQEGSYTFVRTWESVATDDCGNADTIHTFQNIAVLDTTAPQLTETCGLLNGEVVELDCAGPWIFDLDPLPLPCNVEAVDNCDTEVGVARFDEIDDDAPTDGVCNICAPNDPAPFAGGATCDLSDPESMRLFNFDGEASMSFILDDAETSRFDVQCDSSLVVEMVLTNGDGGGFIYTANYGFAGDWDAWSSTDNPYHAGAAGSYKKDCAEVYPGIPVWLDWNYFVLLEGTLEGTGAYAGSQFSLAHQPASAYFGFQVGPGANNKNEAYGASGWFFWDGNLIVDGVDLGSAASSGDIFVDLDCCLPWSATHHYVASDDCGNTTPFHYTVTNSGSEAQDGAGLSGGSQHPDGPVILGDGGISGKQPFRVLGSNPNPTVDLTQLQFEVDFAQRMTIRLHTMSGTHVLDVFDGVAEPGTIYQVEIGVSSLSSGLYQLRMSSPIYSEVRKLLIAE